MMELGNVLALDVTDGTAPKARQDVELGNPLILASGTGLSLRLDMLCRELVEHRGQTLVSLSLVPLACRIASKGDLSKQSLSFNAGTCGRQFPVLTDGDAACAALASSKPILNEIDLPACRCDLETKAGKLVVLEIGISGGGTDRVYGPFGDASSSHVGVS